MTSDTTRRNVFDLTHRGPLRRLMESGGLYPVYQPIVDLRQCVVSGHEALIRGPEDGSLHRPIDLLEAAGRESLLLEFELVCVEVILADWGKRGVPGLVFVNMSADALIRCTAGSGPCLLERLLGKTQVSPRSMVVELTEHERTSDLVELKKALHTAHSLGVEIALDDFGDGHSSLRLWAELRPDFLKIDKFFTQSLATNSTNFEVVRAIRGIAEAFGTELIAEGVEAGDDLRVLRDLEIKFGQGYFLGRPDRVTLKVPSQVTAEILLDGRISVTPSATSFARTGALRGFPIIRAPTVHLSTTNDEVAALFQRQVELHALAVLDDRRPVALINRQGFMNEYARLYFREVHGRRPAVELGNRSPRVIELDHDVKDLIGILTSDDQRYLSDGFVITENGAYLGLGTGDRLVRAVTETRIEAARHANPLTFLPGNIPISLHIERLLASTQGFVAAYIDLDNFKPFNDRYGYWRGDEVIRKVAEIAKNQSSALHDFVGHVGGDDFIVLFQSEDWEQRCRAIIDLFASNAAAFYDEPERLAGGLEAEDRHGLLRRYPFLSLSIGAVQISPNALNRVEDVASAAAVAKRAAKAAASSMSTLSMIAAVNTNSIHDDVRYPDRCLEPCPPAYVPPVASQAPL